MSAAALAAALLLWAPAAPAATEGPPGALRLLSDRSIQESARRVTPDPATADADRPRPVFDGCLGPRQSRRVRPCVYGDRHARTTVVLFGDSHATQYFPAVDRIARQRHWRLVSLGKAACPPMRVLIVEPLSGRPFRACRAWVRGALRWMRRRRPAMVVVGYAVGSTVLDGQDRLTGAAAHRALGVGLAATLRRLEPAVGRVVVIRDAPRPTQDAPSCVAAHMADLRSCAFPERVGLDHPDPIVGAIRQVPGVQLLDPVREFCMAGLCPDVIGDVLVYRKFGHITDTYAGTMTHWLAHRLSRLTPAAR